MDIHYTMESRSGEDDLLGNSVTVKRILERLEKWSSSLFVKI